MLKIVETLLLKLTHKSYKISKVRKLPQRNRPAERI